MNVAPNIAVIIASINRAEEISQLLRRLAEQTLKPCMIVLSVESSGDLPAVLPAHVHVVTGRRGLTLQRNRGLELVLPHCDALVFFDDDFLPTKSALADIAALFASRPGIVAATGLVLGDGVKQGGISHENALAIVAAHETLPRSPVTTHETDAVYGCNMAFRAAAIGTLRFDENLPLYAWQEDVDFAGQLLVRGQVVVTNAFAGVHRGVAKGRTSGLALGFSQIVNPAYLVRKGTMRAPKAIRLMVKNLIANHLRALAPEPFIDRRGRMLGNWRGLLHLATGQTDPQAIVKSK